MLTPDIIESKIRQLKPILSTKFFVDDIGYFGSYSSGNYTKDSDIDILVSFKKPLGWAFDLKSFLESSLQLKGDLVSFNAWRSELKEEIVNQTKLIRY
ncbi:DNA polymerase, beta-like region [Fulvivirga imtechensis AK7]|uniref:DNA polymerase, beta-like region n=1 Tax=Fulvivirga imtechensis AK7 TaxID=1237149 RepID=L8JM01_9BACT|nr:nucleotidyltransferase domain-containing protein [Fulvivirga imtechensis]ELR69830.1 DNA polymerase, beta-like region [Fulvivirga imtechensis AK7]